MSICEEPTDFYHHLLSTASYHSLKYLRIPRTIACVEPNFKHINPFHKEWLIPLLFIEYNLNKSKSLV